MNWRFMADASLRRDVMSPPVMQREGKGMLVWQDGAMWIRKAGVCFLARTRNSAIPDNLTANAKPVELDGMMAIDGMAMNEWKEVIWVFQNYWWMANDDTPRWCCSWVLVLTLEDDPAVWWSGECMMQKMTNVLELYVWRTILFHRTAMYLTWVTVTYTTPLHDAFYFGNKVLFIFLIWFWVSNFFWILLSLTRVECAASDTASFIEHKGRIDLLFHIAEHGIYPVQYSTFV